MSDLCYVFIIILGVIAKGDSKIILYCVVFDAATTLERKKFQLSYASVFRSNYISNHFTQFVLTESLFENGAGELFCFLSATFEFLNFG